MKVSPTKQVPWGREDVLSGKPKRLLDYLKKLIRYLNEAYEELARAVNHNADHHTPRQVAQDGRPTPEDGELVVWQDTDAGSGNPTYYLVVNHGGNIVTFGSEETA
jgi:hypothetical protein